MIDLLHTVKKHSFSYPYSIPAKYKSVSIQKSYGWHQV